jgi:hypothetical protein
VLINNLKEKAKNKIPEELLSALIARISEFKEIDNSCTRFRYGNQLGEEFLINIFGLKETFSEIVLVIEAIKTDQN